MNSMIEMIFLNIHQGVFWIALAFVSGLMAYKGVPKEYRFLGVNTTATLVVFGIVDSVENFFVGYFNVSEWLLILKSICVIGLVFSIFSFLQMVSKEKDGLGEVI